MSTTEAKITEEYPPVRTGGSLLLAWRTNSKHILIVGGGEVACGRVLKALEADARVTLICPEEGLHPELKFRISNDQIYKYINREFDPIDLEEDIDMVLTAIDDPIKSKEIYELSKEKKLPINVADVPSLCDFYFMSEHRDGPLQIAVSTNGQGPKLANIIRRHISENLPNGVGEAINKVGHLRQNIRKIDSDYKSSSKRMQWMSKICEDWSIEDLKRLDDNVIEALLPYYEKRVIPSFNTIKQETFLSDKLEEATKEMNIEEDEHKETKKGQLILVGAGPGDPSLLTQKAIEALSNADLVVSDLLVPKEIFSVVKCETRFALAKSGSQKSVKSDESQKEIQHCCLEGLEKGKNVVRLKIGDPFLFGRGGEEVSFFKKKGFEVNVVPGISSALSAPMSANVPVTHRGLSDQVLIITGQGTQGKLPQVPQYHDMRTTVVLMAVGKAKELSKELLNNNYPDDLPAVFVENGNRPNERIIRATVATLGEMVEKECVVAPSTLIIGRAVNALLE
ncbi:5461_t:CDS:1 [Funneliformis geosporum]|uniref:precorrin-2 dehydrogenase n=1 Tax=Funneliformis geosporum TaxID=1117311 RepID=A0A9W4WR19_9GLOM|nr:5461_t:CDS:1 [Funneliformis geosporum]CAI2165689.1 6314_t:CDS:1 [Funneliformis geosporum]